MGSGDFTRGSEGANVRLSTQAAVCPKCCCFNNSRSYLN